MNDDALVERIARIIDPNSWAVMDSYLAETKRKYRGQNVGWPADQFHHKESMAKARAILDLFPQVTGTPEVTEAMQWPDQWPLGTRVRKRKGSSWQGHVVGYYSTHLTPCGYAVESEREPGSVQIYPKAALEALDPAQIVKDT